MAAQSASTDFAGGSRDWLPAGVFTFHGIDMLGPTSARLHVELSVTDSFVPQNESGSRRAGHLRASARSGGGGVFVVADPPPPRARGPRDRYTR